MNKRKKILSVLISLCWVTVTTASVSAAWFAGQNIVTPQDVTESVMAAYFHSGSGTEADPFTITRPVHYENLCKLHHLVGDFASKKFYFAIGADINGDGTKEVYKYTDTGTYDGTFSTILNLKSLGTLEPIGNVTYPFNSHFDGNNFTIRNFTVALDASDNLNCSDIGIFGYVTGTATIKNVYWDCFTVNSRLASLTPYHNADGLAHNTVANVGYIAGHIVNASSFSNVYVNNCEVCTPTKNVSQRNSYGYFGYVENDISDSDLASGNDYKFTLDSGATYDYFNKYYDSISGNNVALRNTAEGEGKTNGIYRYDDANPLRLSSAVEENSLYYSFNGKSAESNTTNGMANNAYSLSTLGYHGNTYTENHNTDPCVVQKDSDSSYVNLASNASRTTYTASTDPCLTNNQYDSNGKNHFYFDGSKWIYYHADNYPIIKSEQMTFRFLFTAGRDSDTVTTQTRTRTFEWKDKKMYVMLDQKEYTFDINESHTDNRYYFDFSMETQEITVNAGFHSLGIFWRKSFRDGWGAHYDNSKIILGSEVDGALQPLDIGLSNMYYDKSENKICVDVPIDLGSYRWRTANKSDDRIYFTNTKAYTPFTYPTTAQIQEAGDSDVKVDYVLSTKDNKDSAVNTWTGVLCYERNGSKTALSNTSLNNYSNADIFKNTSGVWMVTTYEILVDESSQTSFIADSEEISGSGYNYEYIDVVGGNADFGVLNNYKILRLSCERPNRTGGGFTPIPAVGSSDLNKKFYATNRCFSSIVMYIKNVGNPKDSINAAFGHMDLNLYYGGISIEHPSFMKGDGSYVKLTDVLGLSDDDNQESYSFDLTEYIVQRCCYCALDKDGKIIGTYAKTGNMADKPSYGTGLSDAKANQIETYVLVFGSYTNAGVGARHIYIRSIDFEYTANKGYGGSFGTVGYRSSPDKITNTIFNFYVECDSSVTYNIRVDYSGYVYTVTVKCNKEISIFLYNYDPTNYTVTLKYTKSGATSATSTSYNTAETGEIKIPSTGYGGPPETP